MIMTAVDHRSEYHGKMAELRDKLRKSEEERLKLEEKFVLMMRECREEEEMKIQELKEKYSAFLEEDKKRRDRNERILHTLEKIESRAAALSAKSERLKLLRRHYEVYLMRMYPLWKSRINYPDNKEMLYSQMANSEREMPHYNKSQMQTPLLTPRIATLSSPNSLIDGSLLSSPDGEKIDTHKRSRLLNIPTTLHTNNKFIDISKPTVENALTAYIEKAAELLRVPVEEIDGSREKGDEEKSVHTDQDTSRDLLNITLSEDDILNDDLKTNRRIQPIRKDKLEGRNVPETLTTLSVMNSKEYTEKGQGDGWRSVNNKKHEDLKMNSLLKPLINSSKQGQKIIENVYKGSDVKDNFKKLENTFTRVQEYAQNIDEQNETVVPYNGVLDDIKDVDQNMEQLHTKNNVKQFPSVEDDKEDIHIGYDHKEIKTNSEFETNNQESEKQNPAISNDNFSENVPEDYNKLDSDMNKQYAEDMQNIPNNQNVIGNELEGNSFINEDDTLVEKQKHIDNTPLQPNENAELDSQQDLFDHNSEQKESNFQQYEDGMSADVEHIALTYVSSMPNDNESNVLYNDQEYYDDNVPILTEEHKDGGDNTENYMPQTYIGDGIDYTMENVEIDQGVIQMGDDSGSQYVDNTGQNFYDFQSPLTDNVNSQYNTILPSDIGNSEKPDDSNIYASEDMEMLNNDRNLLKDEIQLVNTSGISQQYASDIIPDYAQSDENMYQENIHFQDNSYSQYDNTMQPPHNYIEGVVDQEVKSYELGEVSDNINIDNYYVNETREEQITEELKQENHFKEMQPVESVLAEQVEEVDVLNAPYNIFEKGENESLYNQSEMQLPDMQSQAAINLPYDEQTQETVNEHSYEGVEEDSEESSAVFGHLKGLGEVSEFPNVEDLTQKLPVTHDDDSETSTDTRPLPNTVPQNSQNYHNLLEASSDPVVFSDQEDVEQQLAALVQDAPSSVPDKPPKPEENVLCTNEEMSKDVVKTSKQTVKEAVSSSVEAQQTSSMNPIKVKSQTKQEIVKTNTRTSKKLPGLTKVLASDSESLNLDEGASNLESDEFDFSTE